MRLVLDSIENEYREEILLPIGSRLGVSYERTLQSEVSVTHRGQSLIIGQAALGAIAITGVVWDCSLLILDFLDQYYSQVFHFESENDPLLRNYIESSLGSEFVFHCESLLDLGCGTGLVGIAASTILGIKHVVLSDCFDCCSENFPSSSSSPGHLSFASFNWNDHEIPPALLTIDSSINRSWDLIICSDVLYEKKFEGLLRLLSALSFKMILFAVKSRHRDHELEFFRKLSQWCHVAAIDIDTITLQNLSQPSLAGIYLFLATKKPS